MDFTNNNARQNHAIGFYTGFGYNATLASRAQITTVITPGMCFCYDNELYNDYLSSDTRPTGTDYGKLALGPDSTTVNPAYAYSRLITRPATNLLSKFFGVAVGTIMPKAYGSQAVGAGPHEIECAVDGEAVPILLNGDFSSETRVMLTDGQFYGVPWAQTAASTSGGSSPSATNVNSSVDAAILANINSVGRIIAECLVPGNYSSTTLVMCRVYGNRKAF